MISTQHRVLRGISRGSLPSYLLKNGRIIRGQVHTMTIYIRIMLTMKSTARIAGDEVEISGIMIHVCSGSPHPDTRQNQTRALITHKHTKPVQVHFASPCDPP